METKHYSITKAATWWIIFGLTGTLFLLLMNSCNDSYELVQPQMLTVTITGDNYFAIAYQKDAPQEPYMLPDHVQVKGVWQKEAVIGDSIDVMIMAGGTPWEVKHAYVTVTLGSDTIANGSTEKTGLLNVRGVLGKELFMEEKK